MTYRRVIAPVPPPQLDADGNPINPIMAMPDGAKAFYVRVNGQVFGCIDYITNQEAPEGALYVCKLEDNEYTVIVEAPADLVVPHGWAGWPWINQ